MKIYSAGPSSALRDVFPAFKAILRIGVPFDICRGALHDPANGNNFFMLACLLKLSGGDYCNLFFENTDSKWPSFPGFPLVAQVVLTSPRAGDAKAKRLLQALPWRRLESDSGTYGF